MTMRKMIAALLLTGLATGPAIAQQKRKTTAKPVHTTVKHDDEDDNHAVADHGNGVIDAHSFYHTPYRTRNNGSYDRDTRIISIGYGFPNTLYNDYGYLIYSYSGSKTGFGPIMGKFEYAIRDEIGIGGVLDAAYRQWKYTAGGHQYRDKAFGVGVSLLGYYHFNKLIPVRKLDVYAGVGVNISHVAYTDDYTGNTNGTIDVLPALVAGARYYFKPDFGPYFEVGRTNYSWVNLGLSFAF